MATLTQQQYATLKADLVADSALFAQAQSGDYDGVAKVYNSPASPDFWGWRTRVSRSELYNETSVASTTWNWATYKSQQIPEQNAWTQMFMGDEADFSKPNLRAGVVAIFSGSAPANAQQAHILAIARRRASRAETVLKANGGDGSAATPATFGWEGLLEPSDIGAVLAA